MSAHPSSLKKQPSDMYRVNLLQLGVEFGVMITLPLIIGILVGLYLDRLFGVLPLLTITGVILALVLSSLLLYKKITQVFREMKAQTPIVSPTHKNNK